MDLRLDSFSETNTAEVYQPKIDLDSMGTGLGDVKMVEMHSSEPVGQMAGGPIPMEAETISLTNNRDSSSNVGFGGSFTGAIGTAISAATTDEGNAAASGWAGSALAYAQTLFDVSTDDVVKRLKLALVPRPSQVDGSQNDFRAKPDFWGPFWIATTAVFFLAATGNFARLLEVGDNAQFKADYGLVSVAAAMIYGALIAVPLITRASLYFSGQEATSINFRQMICVYGYSLAPAIPVSVLCLLPFSFLRWILILIGLVISLVFIRGNLWTDLSVEAPSLKWTMIVMLVGVQATIFLVYRIHFFASAPQST
jgi:hypothetical protein